MQEVNRLPRFRAKGELIEFAALLDTSRDEKMSWMRWNDSRGCERGWNKFAYGMSTDSRMDRFRRQNSFFERRWPAPFIGLETVSYRKMVEEKKNSRNDNFGVMHFITEIFLE